MDINAALEELLAAASGKGAEYADIRWMQRSKQNLSWADGRLQQVEETQESGVGLRVRLGGAWGFAATNRINSHDFARILNAACSAARIAATTLPHPRGDLRFKAQTGSYCTPVRQDPFTVSLDAKLKLLQSAAERLQLDPRVTGAFANMNCERLVKEFLDTQGSHVSQTLTACGAGLRAIATAGNECQSRSYPYAPGGKAAAGYEYIEKLDLVAAAPVIAREALELLQAPECPAGEFDVILGSRQLAYQLHETCGHAFEADRILGTEVSLAGESFFTPGEAAGFTLGSAQVNITADATLPGGLGTFGFDDEGIPAQVIPLVRQGKVLHWLTSRQLAAELGQSSNGCMRSGNWEHVPLIRMTNINLEPGSWDLEALIADTRDGLYLDYNAGSSIDDRRLKFTFGTEIAYEIKGGKLGRLFKNARYSGRTPEFWGKCDAVANALSWQVSSIPDCGKGEPLQLVGVSHGAAPARFKKVKVG